MNFFKRLFSSKKEKTETNNESGSFKGIHTTEYFDKRYTEEKIDAEMLEGCFKMAESYCLDNKIARKIKSPINHPINLDQLDREGMGFVMYCEAFNLGEQQASLFLAFLFSDFLITKYGFKLYKDSQPEFPLRSMTLKYNKDGVILSLYPFEYAGKVLSGNQTFLEMEEKLNSTLAAMPKQDDIINDILKSGNK